MKATVLAFAAVLMLFSVSYAEGPMEPVSDSQELTGIMSFAGKIGSVETMADGAIKIMVLGMDNDSMTFNVEPGTQMMGAEGNILTAGQLHKDMAVSVEYVMLPGGELKVMSVQQN